jgi:hypothetical protein
VEARIIMHLEKMRHIIECYLKIGAEIQFGTWEHMLPPREKLF